MKKPYVVIVFNGDEQRSIISTTRFNEDINVKNYLEDILADDKICRVFGFDKESNRFDECFKHLTITDYIKSNNSLFSFFRTPLPKLIEKYSLINRAVNEVIRRASNKSKIIGS